MALDSEYFDNIHIEVAKKKYYNANKVEAVLADIRRQAEALNAENESLRSELQSLSDKKAELGDALLSAQSIYRDIVEKANARANEILTDAEERSGRLNSETQRRQEESVQRVGQVFEKLKQTHLDAIDAINPAWQEFLCELYPPEEAEESAPKDAAPADLEERVGAIANQLLSWDE